MRKTHTSCAVKDRWNRNHYDQVMIRTANGGREAIQELAELRGLSVAAYIRHLIIKDAETLGKADISGIIGGGGNSADYYRGASAEVTEVFKRFM